MQITQKVEGIHIASNYPTQTFTEILSRQTKCFESKKKERLIPTRWTTFAEMASGKLGF